MKFNVKVIINGNSVFDVDICGTLYVENDHYHIVTEQGQNLYYPIQFTIIEEKKENKKEDFAFTFMFILAWVIVFVCTILMYKLK